MKQFYSTSVRLFIFVVGCSLVLLFYATHSSLLFPQYNYDYVVYRAMGMGWLDGLIPYKDIFDHKGPLVYLIQMLGIKLFPGKIGLWVLELIFSVFTFELLYRIGVALKVSNKLLWLSLLASFLGFAAYVDGGNTVEEWSLPFQLLSVLFLINCIYKKGNVRLLAFLIGLCFGAVAMIRINNNCIICGILLGMAISLSIEKRWKDLACSCVAFICGIVLVVAPLILYFFIHDALADFFYCNFIFNMLYKAVWENEYSITKLFFRLVRLSPCVILAIAAIVNRNRVPRSLSLSFFFIGVVTLLVFITGANYPHYYLMELPAIALSVMTTSTIHRIPKSLVFVLIISPLILRCYKLADSRKENIKYCTQSAGQYMEKGLLDIPKNDIDSIYVYDDFFICSKILNEGHLPIGKYFFLQNRLINVDSKIAYDINDSFIESKPKWIISSVCLSEVSVINTGDDWELAAIEPFSKKKYYIYKRK